MSRVTTWVATVEPDHTVKVPEDLPVGEQVVIMRIPPISTLLADPARRERFAATQAAVREAIDKGSSRAPLSDEEIVALVKRARKATKNS